jgi:hypothetical protein
LCPTMNDTLQPLTPEREQEVQAAARRMQDRARAERQPVPRLRPAQIVSDPTAREQVREAAATLLPQPCRNSANCAFVAAALGACGRPLLYNPFPPLQAVLIQLTGALLVSPERTPEPGWVYVVAEAGEIVDLGLVKQAWTPEAFLAVNAWGEPHKRSRGSVAYWLVPGGG